MVPGTARILDSVGCWRFQLDGDGSVEDGGKEGRRAYLVGWGESRRADRRGSSSARRERIRGLQQNLWVASGFGSWPSVWYRAISKHRYERKPYAFFLVSFALLLKPSTMAAEISPRARNQFKSSGRWRRGRGAIFFI